MSSAAHAAPDDRSATADLQDLVAAVSGPMGAMLSTLGQGAVTIVQHLLDQSYEAGRARGRADAEYRVAHTVGVPDTRHGVSGTWLRCGGCAGEGLVFQPGAQPGPVGTVRRPSPHPGQAATAVIPRVPAGEAETTQLHLDQLRQGQPPPGR